MKRIAYILTLPVLTMMMAGCGSHNDHEPTAFDPIKVTLGTARADVRSQSVQVSGRIEAGNSANVSTRMMGNVARVEVQPGETVKKGQLIIALSSVDLQAKQAQVQASILQARSAFNNAEKDLERFKILHEKGSASAKELENMTTRFEMAQAGLEAAQQMEKEVAAQFAYTHLRAPFDGVVANTFVKVGDIAHPGMPLATVEGETNYEATVFVPESEIARVDVGADASVLIKSTSLTLKGKVAEVSPSAKNTGGQFLVKIALEDVADILPGMFVNASITVHETPSIKSSPTISEDALIRNGQLTGVYAVGTGQTAILRWIRTGKSQNGQVEVLAGISEGEQYIIKADGKLFNGAKVATQPIAER